MRAVGALFLLDAELDGDALLPLQIRLADNGPFAGQAREIAVFLERSQQAIALLLVEVPVGEAWLAQEDLLHGCK